MNAVRIQTTVSYEQWQLIQQNNWKYSEIVKRGISALIKPEVLVEKVAELEKKVEVLIKAKNRGWR